MSDQIRSSAETAADIDVGADTAADTALSFEAAYAALQDTVDRLQVGGLSLLEAVDLYERGTRLADICAKRLQEAELRVSQLSLDDDPAPGSTTDSSQAARTVISFADDDDDDDDTAS